MRSPIVFSLSSGMLFMAVMAVFLMCLRMGVVEFDYLNRPALTTGGILGLLVGLVAGIVVGLKQQQRTLGFVVGMFTGIIFGTLSGLALSTPNTFPIFVGGSVVILVSSLVIRAFSSQPDEL